MLVTFTVYLAFCLKLGRALLLFVTQYQVLSLYLYLFHALQIKYRENKEDD